EAATGGVQFAPSEPITCDEAIMGNDEVDPTLDPTAHVHPVYVIHDSADLHKILLGKCLPVDFAVKPSGLDCTDTQVADLGTAKTGANFPSLAIDKAGNLFAVWEQQA